MSDTASTATVAPGTRVAHRGDGAYPGTVALIDASGLVLVYGDSGLKFWALPRILATR